MSVHWSHIDAGCGRTRATLHRETFTEYIAAVTCPACIVDIARSYEKVRARVAELEREVQRVRDLINRDRTGLASSLGVIIKIASGYRWIGAGETSSYSYDELDEKRLRFECGQAIDRVIEIATNGLRESGALADAAFHPKAEDASGQQPLHAALSALSPTTRGEDARQVVDEIGGGGGLRVVRGRRSI